MPAKDRPPPGQQAVEQRAGPAAGEGKEAVCPLLEWADPVDGSACPPMMFVLKSSSGSSGLGQRKNKKRQQDAQRTHTAD